MIEYLLIRNLAIIKELEVQFCDGLNIFTGETGAGKSIILDAIEILFGIGGKRIFTDVIREGENKCEITAKFVIPKDKEVMEILSNCGIEYDESEGLILRREISIEGRGRCFVNAIQVPLNVLQQLGNSLIEIHGQHEYHKLLYPEEQLNIVDRYGDIGPQLEEYRKVYERYLQLKTQLNSLLVSEKERLSKIDLYKFQIEEIESANLKINEDVDIENEYIKLCNAEKLSALMNEVYACLYDSDNSIYQVIKKIKKLIEMASTIDASQTNTVEKVDSIIYEIDELIDNIRGYSKSLEFSPERLESISERREVIKKLKKKYGATIQEILEYKEKIKNELDSFLHCEENIENIEKEINIVYQKLKELAEEITEERKKVVKKLKKEVENELHELGFAKVSFYPEVSNKYDTEGNVIFTNKGKDHIEFKIEMNPGEGVKPLKEIASGGELSRIMLALKSILAKVDSIPILIFDEIDTGIGGSMGKVVGEKLYKLSRRHQVICITHLPQIASYGDNHIYVKKETIDGRTYAQVEILRTKDARLKELVRMLGGTLNDQTVVKHAEKLLLRGKYEKNL